MDYNKGKIALRNFLFAFGIILVAFSVSFLINIAILNPETDVLEQMLEPSKPDFKVLFLDSYSPTHSSYPSQEEGLKEGLYSNNISYDVVYMDTKNYASDEDLSAFHDYFKERLLRSKKTYSGVICGDDAALKFALDFQEELFPGIPIVFYGINNINLANEAVKNPLITGFSEATYLDETIEQASKLLPLATKVVGIFDETATGLGDKATFFSFEDKFPEFTFIGLDTSLMTREEFGNHLMKLGNDVILIYLTAFEDSEGNKYTIPESVKFIIDHTAIPVFRNYSEGHGQGIVGGTMMNFPEQCRMAGETMNRVLRGEDISKIPLYTETSGITTYDWGQVKKFGLDMSLLPSETNFVNRPVKYFQQYKAFVFSVCLFLLGIILIFIAMMLNYSMLKSAEVRLQYDVDHDLSLGTFNRHAAEHYLESELNNKHHIAMLRIDIDNFKTLNETYGHAVGDQYLHHAAGLLKRYAEDNNYYLARYSGDEFIMFVSEANVLKDSPAVLGVHEIFKTPMTVGMESLKSTVSIGLVNSDINSTVDSMFVNSEIAKSSAKEHGKNTAAVFTSEFEESARTVNITRTKVMNAIEKGGFYMVYQPKVDVQTRELVGYEALVRIKDDNISPAVFIPVAEQSGLISQIGRITTELAIRQLAEWREQGIELHPISINYSSNQINDAGYIKFLKGLLKKYDIDPKYVEIEITEGLFMESTWQAGNLFVQFQAMGIKLLMDDFGTGYSSLSYLTYIPVDILKLDRSLVVNYLVKGKDAFIRDVINLTHDLGKKMVIEGVEEEWQFERLKEFGADVIQGYYFSKPLPPEDACRWTWKGSK